MIGLTLALLATVQQPPDPVAIRDARIVVEPGKTIEKGTVLLRDGLIEAVGEKVAVPPGVEVIDGAGLVVYAGFIDAHARVGLPEETRSADERKAAEGVPPDPAKGPLVAIRAANRKDTYPDYEAHRHVAFGGEALKKHREAGFAMMLVAPPTTILGGTSALVTLNGETRRTFIVRPTVAMHAGLSAGRNGYPRTIMGVMAHLRQLFLDVDRYRKQVADYGKGKPRPPEDPAFEALLPVLEGELPVAFEVNGVNYIRRALSLSREFGLRPWIVGGAEAYKAIPELKAAKAPVLLTLKWPDDPEKLRKEERREKEPKKRVEERQRLWEERITCAVALHKAGIPFAFRTHEVSPGDAIKHVRTLVKKGLPGEVALRALTVAPAEILGVGPVAGKVEPGRIANLSILSGPLKEAKSKVRYVFADGRKFDLTKEKAGAAKVELAGTWKLTIDSAFGAAEATLELEQDGPALTGRYRKGEKGGAMIEDGKADGAKVSFTVPGKGKVGALKFSGQFKEGKLSGTVTSKAGKSSWKGERPE